MFPYQIYTLGFDFDTHIQVLRKMITPNGKCDNVDIVKKKIVLCFMTTFLNEEIISSKAT